MVDLDTYDKYVVVRKINDKYHLYSFMGSLSTVNSSFKITSIQRKNAIGFYDKKEDAEEFLKGCFNAAKQLLLIYGELIESESSMVTNMSPSVFNTMMKSYNLLNDLSYFIAQSMITSNGAILFKSYESIMIDLDIFIIRFDDISHKVDIIDFGRCYYNIVD